MAKYVNSWEKEQKGSKPVKPAPPTLHYVTEDKDPRKDGEVRKSGNKRLLYKGYIIESRTKQRRDTNEWTTEIHIEKYTDKGVTATQYFANNEYNSEDEADKYCILFGQQIIDGKIHPEKR